eukprot:CAMPEP_0172922822 /NCGR_PEP_ID=MMETSP1075-20121228/208613_1 /TAXON_ID=2916 /ORGANISM="Ceratium fusus, Strain PA161109" /LENGTH=81 /DNA_ID=CAMNT_0013783193 /DNA_START=80 /DNA_END=323 /DNA_ORIENTATION=+
MARALDRLLRLPPLSELTVPQSLGENEARRSSPNQLQADCPAQEGEPQSMHQPSLGMELLHGTMAPDVSEATAVRRDLEDD